MQSGVLLHVRQLLESSLAVRAFVRFLAGVHANVLHQLMVAAETLQALLTLVWLDFGAHCGGRRTESSNWTHAVASARPLYVAGVHLHGTFVHENLNGGRKEKRNGQYAMHLALDTL